MDIPRHLWRFPTADAIASLAARFGFPNTSAMQDWEWEVADPARIDEFLVAYSSGELSSDERFTLMETIIQSFEDSGEDLASDPRWRSVLGLLDEFIDLHIYTVWYWACDEDGVDDGFRVTKDLRSLLGRHRRRFVGSGGAG